MNTWYTVKVKYIKQLEDGRLKSVTEPYLVDATSFTEAEARIYEEIGAYVRGDFTIRGIARTEYADVFYYDDSEDWYKCKLTYVSIDADAGKEKKITSNFLVTASSVKEAYERIKESLADMTVSFEVPAITLTPIVEVLPYDPSLAEKEEIAQAQAQVEAKEEDVYQEESEDDYEDESFEVEEDDVTFVDETEEE